MIARFVPWPLPSVPQCARELAGACRDGVVAVLRRAPAAAGLPPSARRSVAVVLARAMLALAFAESLVVRVQGREVAGSAVDPCGQRARASMGHPCGAMGDGVLAVQASDMARSCGWPGGPGRTVGAPDGGDAPPRGGR